MDKITQVKRDHEKEWLNLEGVVSIGVGQTKTRRKGIIIGVKKITREIAAHIPFEVDGVPIEIAESGEVKAH